MFHSAVVAREGAEYEGAPFVRRRWHRQMPDSMEEAGDGLLIRREED